MIRVTAKHIHDMTSALDENMEEQIDKWLLARAGDLAAGQVTIYQEQINVNLKILAGSLRKRGFSTCIKDEVTRNSYLQISIPPQGD